MPTIAQQFADWATALRADDVPPAVRAIARACLVDTGGCASGGAGERASRLAREHAVATCARGGSTIIGADGAFVASGAALVNATTAHALDFDDNCYAGLVHGSAVVAPAVLATGETAGLSGAEIVTAFVAGVEVEYAIGKALSQSIYDRGWWTTGVLGTIGAAAGAARALRLAPGQMAHAIAIAAAGTGGMRVCLGTDAKPILAGRAAEAGVAAAHLAARGATGPVMVFEDTRGLAALFNGGRFDHDILATLGSSWRLRSPGVDVKKYPVCLSGHAAADGVLDLMRDNRLAADDVANVTCTVPPVVGANLGYGMPATPQQAQFSLPFAVACMLVHGDIALDHLREEALADPALVAAMRKVAMVVADDWPLRVSPYAASAGPEAAFVDIVTTDGRRIGGFSGWARGTAARPLAPSELAAKFMGCATRNMPADGAQALLATIEAIEALPDAREILRTLARSFSAEVQQSVRAGGARCDE
jgi:2-methylcitrate dehydratase PrpD